jgi:WD40 repeat protein
MFNGATLGRLESIETLWKEEIPHSLILGDGGTGKTVSMIQLWKDFLSEEKTISGPIPIFVRLNEYNQATEEERKDFISWYIGWHYLGKKSLTPALKNAIWDWLRAEPATPHPKLLLMLDGFNEITVDNTQLLIELNNSWRRAAKGIQILLTSRYEANFEWTKGFQKLELQPLQKRNIIKYLSSKGKSYPEGNENLQAILRVPMMLTLYAASSEIQAKYQQDTNFQFKGLVSTTGELMWNFMEAQVVKYTQQYETEPQIAAHYRWLLKHFLPLIGYEMEKQGLFDFSRKQLKAVWKKYVAQLQEEERRDLHFELFAPSEVIWEKAEEKELEKVSLSSLLDDLSAHLRMLKKERNTYHFLHQNFRDFFAAVHLRNELLLSNAMKAPGVILKDRPLPVFIRKMLGEIEGEHYNRPRIVKDKWSIAHYKATILDNALACSRGIFGRDTIGYINWNILTIWKDLRQELSGCDLSHLDLSNVVMNGTRFSRPGLVVEMRGAKVRGQNLLNHGHRDTILRVQFSSDGKEVLSEGESGLVKKWNIVSGECLQTISIGHKETIESVHYNPDSEWLFCGTLDGSVEIWDTISGECIQKLSGHNSYVKALHYIEERGKIVSADGDGHTKIWDMLSAECTQTLTGYRISPDCLSVSPNGEKVAISDWNQGVMIWDVESGNFLLKIVGARLISMCFSSDGERIVGASLDGKIKIWDAKSGFPLHKFYEYENKARPISVQCSPDGKKIISGQKNGEIKIWDAKSRKCLYALDGHKYPVTYVCYSPCGGKIVSADESGNIMIWDDISGRCLQNLTGKGNFAGGMHYSPNSKLFASTSYHNTIKILDVDRGVCIQTLTGHEASICDLQFSTDSKKIVSIDQDYVVNVWDVSSELCLQTFRHNKSVGVCFSIDGQRVFSWGEEMIKVWDVKSGKCLGRLTGHTDVEGLCVSSYCERVVSVGDNVIKIWDVEKRVCLQTLSGHKDVNRVCISPDGMKIASGGRDYTIKIWDIKSGVLELTLKGHDEATESLSFSPNGERLASACYDDTIRIWDIAGERCIQTLGDQSSGYFIYNVQYSSSGERIVSENFDGIIKIWDSISGEPLGIIDHEPGLIIHNCNFNHLHPDSKITDKEKAALIQYGAIFDDNQVGLNT